MRTLAILKNLALTLLLTLAASTTVNANLASGPQNLVPDLHQAASWLKPAPRLGWSGSSYDGAPESPVVAKGKTVFIGKLDDLRGIPKDQTLLPELTPDLGSVRANLKRNSSVLRRKLREGFTIQDASVRRLNTDLDPTILRPDRTVGQSFLGAERLILENKGLKLNPRTGVFE